MVPWWSQTSLWRGTARVMAVPSPSKRADPMILFFVANNIANFKLLLRELLSWLAFCMKHSNRKTAKDAVNVHTRRSYATNLIDWDLYQKSSRTIKKFHLFCWLSIRFFTYHIIPQSCPCLFLVSQWIMCENLVQFLHLISATNCSSVNFFFYLQTNLLKWGKQYNAL